MNSYKRERISDNGIFFNTHRATLHRATLHRASFHRKLCKLGVLMKAKYTRGIKNNAPI